MREILFRGQTQKFGEKVNMAGEKLPGNWVYGGVFPGIGDFSVIYDTTDKVTKHSVYSDTVGEYTGLTDKNGTKIFEGDILRMTARITAEETYNWYAAVAFGNPNRTYNWGWHLKPIGGCQMNPDILLWVGVGDTGAWCEVVGNVWDGSECDVMVSKCFNFCPNCGAKMSGGDKN